jgi:amino acid adenylation domain-containing protein
MVMKRENVFQHKLSECLIGFKDHAAVESGNRVITYAQLDRRSNFIANWIVDRSIQRGSFIGIAIHDRVEFIITMIGILKAGCVFLPLDTAYPRDRLEAEINVTGTQFIFAARDDLSIWDEHAEFKRQGKTFIPVEDLFLKGEISWFYRSPLIRYSPDDKIYIYFTSGTTGKPKGVLGKNKSLLHFIEWEIETFRVSEGYRFSQFTSVGFDAFLRDVFVPLCAGGIVCIPEQPDIFSDPAKLLDWTNRYRINLIHCVPFLFRILNANTLRKDHLQDLKFILLSGERIHPADLLDWYAVFTDRIRLVNLYGPTETTMIKTYYFIQESDVQRERIPVGKPMRGSRVIVFDEGMRICPKEVIGELYIRTPYGTSGYYDEPGLNKERFIANPISDRPDDLLYKTGDLGRILADGNIELIGRIDRQVKIRGVRIELEEIEHLLSQVPSVKEAVAVESKDSSGKQLLLGFITKNEKAAEISVANIYEYLSKMLPDYMIPNGITIVDKIPRKPNGKTDYDALLDRFVDEETGKTPPESHIEKRLAKIWHDTLGVENIGVDSRFFALGASSLNVMSLIFEIHREFNVKIPVAEIFKNPTVRRQAQLIENSDTNIYEGVKKAEKREYYALSSAQKRLYILQQMDTAVINYNIPVVAVLAGRLAVKKMEAAFKTVIERHDSFRTSFVLVDDRPVQKIQECPDFKIEYYTPEPKSASTGAPLDHIIKNFIRFFDLGQAPLLRVGLLKLEKEKHILMVDMHHIVSDGISMDIFLKEFMVLYGEEELPTLKFQYKDFSEWQNRLAGTASLDRQKAYWLRQFSGQIPVLKLPTDYPRPRAQSYEGNCLDFEIGQEETRALKDLALKEDASLYMVLLTVFNVFFSKLSGQEDIVIGTPIAGRRHADLDRVIGMFVNTLALRNYPEKHRTFRKFLQEIRERTLEAFDNQDFQFENLVNELPLDRDAAHNPLFDVVFVFQNIETLPTAVPGGRIPELKLRPYGYVSKISRYDLAFAGQERGGKLTFSCEYCTKLFKDETVRGFTKYFTEIVCAVLKNNDIKLEDIRISHDLYDRELDIPEIDFDF